RHPDTLFSPLAPAAMEGEHHSPAELDEVPPELEEFFRGEAAEDLRGLRHCLLYLERQPEELAHLADMRQIAHKLKGSAWQFGFAALAEATLKLEDAVKALQRSQTSLSGQAIAALAQLLDF